MCSLDELQQLFIEPLLSERNNLLSCLLLTSW